MNSKRKWLSLTRCENLAPKHVPSSLILMGNRKFLWYDLWAEISSQEYSKKKRPLFDERIKVINTDALIRMDELLVNLFIEFAICLVFIMFGWKVVTMDIGFSVSTMNSILWSVVKVAHDLFTFNESPKVWKSYFLRADLFENSEFLAECTAQPPGPARIYQHVWLWLPSTPKNPRRAGAYIHDAILKIKIACHWQEEEHETSAMVEWK